MDSSLAALTAQPIPLEVDGRTYQLHPLRLSDWGQIQAWCDARSPSPFASVARQLGNGLFTPAQEEGLLRQAIRLDQAPRPRLGSAECDALIQSFDGIAKILHLAIAKGDPGFTEARAGEILAAMNAGHLALVRSALDVETVVGGGGGDDPKASTSGACSTPR